MLALSTKGTRSLDFVAVPKFLNVLASSVERRRDFDSAFVTFLSNGFSALGAQMFRA
jgi:hypothetical protein